MRRVPISVAFLVLVLLFLGACLAHPDDSEDESEVKESVSRTPELPQNQEAPSEIIPPEELQPVITEDDLKRIERIPIEDIAGCSEDEAKAMLAENNIDVGTRELLDACLFGSRKLSLLLLTAGGDPNAKMNYGGYPISAACLGGNAEIITDLVERGADLKVRHGELDSPCIHLAAQSGNTSAVDLILDYGAKVDDRNGLNQTALMVVCTAGMRDMAEYLLSLGADISVKDNNDRGPLHSAVNGGSLPTVRLLVEKGADLNALDKSAGMSPIYASALMGHEDVFVYLLKAGAELQKETRNGINIIHAASITQSQKIVEILLNRGFDINDLCIENGGRPILAALEANEVDRDFVKFLVENGADVNVFNKTGASPLTLAAIGGYVEVFHDLIDAGADYKAVNEMGVPALHFVIMADNAEMVQTMVDLGVDLYARDNEGKTALDRSIEYSCNNSERVLREAMGLPPDKEEIGSESTSGERTGAG